MIQPPKTQLFVVHPTRDCWDDSYSFHQQGWLCSDFWGHHLCGNSSMLGKPWTGTVRYYQVEDKIFQLNRRKKMQIWGCGRSHFKQKILQLQNEENGRNPQQWELLCEHSLCHCLFLRVFLAGKCAKMNTKQLPSSTRQNVGFLSLCIFSCYKWWRWRGRERER